MVGHIKIDRKILNWEWYSDYKMVHLFLHLLIKANWVDGMWRGRVIKRGQYMTSISTLSGNTGLTISQIRTCLSKLQSTGEIANEMTNANTLITICKYETYQSEKNNNSKQNDTPLDKRDSTPNSTPNSNNIRKQEDKNNIIKKGEAEIFNLPPKENSDYVCYDVEEYVLENQKLLEKICIATGKKTDEVKKELHLYHLWLAKNEKYPFGKKAATAGIESWILNASTFKSKYKTETTIDIKTKEQNLMKSIGL